MGRCLELAPVLQVGGDAGGAEGVVVDPGLDAGLAGAPAHHVPGILRGQGTAAQSAGATLDGGPWEFLQPSTLREPEVLWIEAVGTDGAVAF